MQSCLITTVYCITQPETIAMVFTISLNSANSGAIKSYLNLIICFFACLLFLQVYLLCIGINSTTTMSSDPVSNTISSKQLQEEILTETVRVLNELGRTNGTPEALHRLLKKGREGINATVFRGISEEQNKAQNNSSIFLRLKLPLPRTKIVLAILVCGNRRQEALIMLKSAVMFSLDAHLHVVVFSDKETISGIGQDVLQMKLGLSKIGYFGFSFELQLEWYPKYEYGIDWKTMYKKCATQRLFFPTALEHHDAVIYMDTDVLILANLTELWEMFESKMGEMKMLGVTPNSEVPGRYHPKGLIPYYGDNGINAGVMLMNLTQMRQFNFESRAKAFRTTFNEKLELADQDIINGILHSFPEKAVDITCAYNFYWIHCNHPVTVCYEEHRTKNICFCNEVLKSGVRVIHGNSGSFEITDKNYLFISQACKSFKELNMFTDSYAGVFKSLTETFNQISPSPCFPMTADALYGNAAKYLRNLQLQ